MEENNSITEWPEIIRDWQHTKLSVSKYCKQNNLVYHQFQYWKRKLAEPSADPLPSKPSPFVQVAGVSHTDRGLTLALPNGIHIKGLTQDNINLLHRILDQL